MPVSPLSTASMSAFGADPTGPTDLYVTLPHGTLNSLQNGLGTNQPSNDMLTMLFSLGSPSVASSNPDVFIQANGDVSSWAAYNFGASSTTQAWEAYGSTETLIGTGGTGVLDLYHVLGDPATGAASLLGTLGFSTGTGNITFTAAPVPEPSTVASLFFSAVLGGAWFVFRRVRRSRASH